MDTMKEMSHVSLNQNFTRLFLSILTLWKFIPKLIEENIVDEYEINDLEKNISYLRN